MSTADINSTCAKVLDWKLPLDAGEHCILEKSDIQLPRKRTVELTDGHGTKCPTFELPLWKVVKRNKFLSTLAQIRRRQWHPTPVLLPGKSHEWRSLVGCSPWGC